MKLSCAAKDLTNEAEALKVFSGFDATTILAQKDNALLLERVVSGIALKEYSSDNRIAIACSVMSKLYKSIYTKNAPIP
ncbi:hypothetical protein FLA4_10900 [Candidatus Rickettsia kotlanii]|nr:hypothetical protein FLA4_10900 [Candidatus Rickettsia kotlanii]BDU61923.1 hypothetical protein HM2_10910 [Candidatus Rickettsia kotlanii]